MKWWDQMPWSLFFECCVLSQLFHSLLSPSSRGSLVLLCFLPLGWCHLYIWGYCYFSQQSWFQLVIHPAQHSEWCTLHISEISRVTILSECYVASMWTSLMAQLVKNTPTMKENRFNSWVRRIHWRRARLPIPVFLGFPCGSAGKESAYKVGGDLDSFPGLGRSPGEGKGYPLQYSGLENSMDWIVPGVSKSQIQLSNFHFHFARMWNECSCMIVWTFFGIALLWDWNENWPFSVLWPLLSVPNLLTYWV